MGLLELLEAGQRAAAVVPAFDDPRRLEWDIIPRPDRTGLSLQRMDREQRILTWELVRMTVPLRTFTKILAITQLEHVLREQERLELGPATHAWRSSDSYSLTFFGRPAFEDTWTMRFLGHHVCLNVTVVEERWVSATPMALGQQPTEYPGVLRPLADDEGLGFALLHSLTDAQRARAIVHDVAPPDFVARQVPAVGAFEYPDHYDLGVPEYRISTPDRAALVLDRAEPRGIAGDELDPAQRDRLWALVDCYLERLPEESVPRARAAVRAAGLGATHFAWAGATQPGRPHYFRVQTPAYLIEAVNAVDGGNHLHSVLRELDHDLGASLLAHGAGSDPQWGPGHLRTRTTSSAERPPLG